MASSFMGITVQKEAIMLAQKALDVTGNNIANIETPGYTRQRLDVCSIANSKGTLGYNTGVALAGRGADAIGVSQIRDRLRDKKVREYSSDLCDVGVKNSTLCDVEDIFDSIEADSTDTANTGFSFAAIVSKFKAALQGFSADHADRAELASVAENAAQSVVQCIITYNKKINDVSERVLGDATKTVSRINRIFQDMGALNKEIKNAYISMGYTTPTLMNYEVMNDYGPLELKDKMNALLDELSQYGNIKFKEEQDGTFTVDFAGQNVVKDRFYAQMAMTSSEPEPTKMEFIISNTLYERDDWYDLNIQNKTGGNCELLVRKGQAGEVTNITGKDESGQFYLLSSGSMRGYLDVYNGRGGYAYEEVYTDEALDATQKILDEANAIIANIASATDADKTRLAALTGAVVADDGTVTLDGKPIDGSKTLTAGADGTAKLGDDEIKLGGDAGKAYTEISNQYKGIEYYRDMLNAFVKTATEEFNSIYAEFGKELFTYKNDDGELDFRTAAENFRVADDWKNNPSLIANPTGKNNFEELDNVYINKMLGVFATKQQYGDGTHFDEEEFNIETYISHICDDIGMKINEETALYETTDIMLTGEEELRSSAMHVAMNEEGVNMMNYQKWYNAIARMITTMDEALDKLINGTGVVGL